MQASDSLEESYVAAEEQMILYAERVKQLYGNGLVGLLASTVNSIVLAVIQRDVISNNILITWVAVLALISSWRYFDIQAFRLTSPDATEVGRWAKRFIAGLALSGMAWGSSAIFLFPIESLAHQTFLAFVIGGMVAGAAAAFSSLMSAFLAYSVPTLVPIVIRFVLVGDEFHLAMGGMALLFGVIAFFIAKQINVIRTTSVKLRFQNSGLVSYITEHRRMEEELHKSHERLELCVKERTAELARQAHLLELTHDAIVVRDMEGRITFWNKGAEEMYGWSRDETLGEIVFDLLETEYPGGMDKAEVMRCSEGWWEGEVIQKARDGSRITVASRCAPQTENGVQIGVLAIDTDITEQKRVEEQLRQSQKLEALGTLAGGIAHDFNNILAAIIGFTELADDHLPDTIPEKRFLKRVVHAATRGRDLVRQMLAFSRKADEEKKPLILSSIVRETAGLLRASIPSTVTMNVNIRNESGMILGDPIQMQQIIMNLCTNAAQAMNQKGVLDIEMSDFTVAPSDKNLHGIAPGTYLRLTVRDTGPGIPEEIMDRIFDPFFTTKKQGQGTGLGLSVVMGIVKHSQGYIKAESEPGAGAAFTVYLPNIEKGATPEAVTLDEPIYNGHERILLVDDEESLVEMGEQVLTELGYAVVCKTSSKEALALFKLDPSLLDLVITDQTMPDMTGLELAGELLAVRPDIPIILATGFSNLVDPDSAKAAGVKGYVMKPLTKKELAMSVRNVLDN